MAKAAVGCVLFPVALGAVGVWNPWNLTYLDSTFTAPFLGVVFLAGVGLLWHLHAPGRRTRAVGFVGLFLCLPAGCGVMAVKADIDEIQFREHIVNPDNDVEAEMTSTYNVWDVWLRADRGLLSREQRVARIGRGDSGPPLVEARFVDADELVITAQGEEVYRVRFDLGDLHVVEEEETCRASMPGALPHCVP